MDELHHASLCQHVVSLLGGEPDVEGDLSTEALPEHRDASRLEAALRNVMFVGCMSETVALALLSEERELTTEPAIHHVVSQLAADETLHAKLGWSFLAETWPKLDDPARERTRAYLPIALGYLEEKMLGAMPLSDKPPPAALMQEARALGVVGAREGRELLYEVIGEVILPRLEDHGLPASARGRRASAPARSAPRSGRGAGTAGARGDRGEDRGHRGRVVALADGVDQARSARGGDVVRDGGDALRRERGTLARAADWRHARRHRGSTAGVIEGSARSALSSSSPTAELGTPVMAANTTSAGSLRRSRSAST